MKFNRAIIPIQKLNCQNCAIQLANKLSQIKYVSQLHVDYKSSKISFNFQNIMDVAIVENMLADFGFNPKGEQIKKKRGKGFFCNDASRNFCIDEFS